MSPESQKRLWDALETQREAVFEMRETLVRLETRFDALAGPLSELTGQVGTARCAERGQRIAQCEQRLGTLCARLWRLAVAISVPVLLLGVRGVWNLLTA